jgi:hypothetical protein
MNKIHEPDSRFLERLEWQLSSEYRRTNRLKSSSRSIAVPRRMVAIAVMIGILLTGVAVTKAADYIRDSWRKKIEMARVETEVELKKVQLESIRDMAFDIKMRVENGLVREDEYQAVKLALENAELDLQRSLLNLDEVDMSGDIPRNELYAPLVGGRDFVSERLMMDIKQAELGLKQLRMQQERVEQLVEKNAVRGDELAQVQGAVAERKLMIDKIQQRLDLRARFLAVEITAREVEIEDRMSGAQRNLEMAQSRVASIKKQLARLETLEAEGMISHMEAVQLQHALDAAQAQLKLATLEMDVLKKLE